MDAQALLDDVVAARGTELDRLGSGKLLVALTGADLEATTVLATAAASEHAAARTFESWADTEDNERARTAFADVATQEHEHYDRVAAHLPPDYEPADGGALHAYLRGREGTVARVAGGLLGRTLVSTRAHTQVISFFVNEADRERADLFRDLKADTEEEQERGLALLDAVCETEDDRETARATAEYVISVAYDEYEDSLAGLGVDPKPVC